MKLNNWKLDVCEFCGEKKMLKEDCALCGIELCEDCVNGNTGTCPNCVIPND